MTEGIYLQGRKPRISPKLIDDPAYYDYRDRLQEFEHDVHFNTATFDNLLTEEQIKEKKDFVAALNSRSHGIPASSARRRFRQYLRHFEPADRYNPLVGKDLSADDRERDRGRESNHYHRSSRASNERHSSQGHYDRHQRRHSDRNNNGHNSEEELSPRQIRRKERKQKGESSKYSPEHRQNSHSDRERRSKPRDGHDEHKNGEYDRHDRHRHHGHRNEKPYSRDRSHR